LRSRRTKPGSGRGYEIITSLSNSIASSARSLEMATMLVPVARRMIRTLRMLRLASLRRRVSSAPQK
jgi:hypothetical protein